MTDDNDAVNSSILGLKFDNKYDVKVYVEEFNKKNFTNFVIESKNSQTMMFYCKHGVHRNSKSNGTRVNQHYNYLACSARIRLYRGVNSSCFKVTKADLEHNHPITKEFYESQNVNITDAEKDLITTLQAANAKPSQIKRVLYEKSHKKVTIQKLKNLINKLSPANPETDEKLVNFLESTENDGGIIEWLTDDDGTMKSLFITSSKMKSAFRSSNPTLIQLDTSFEFEKARYKVAAFCYLDANSDKTEIAALGLLCQESESCFRFIFEQFAKICIRQDIIFITDKDFTEINTLKKIFPGSIILLCQFHTIKFMHCLFSTIPDYVEVKGDIMGQFKRVLYSKTENAFNNENEIFLKLTENVLIRNAQQNYVNLKEYYQRNWESVKLMWVTCFRRHLPLLGDNTTNRIERKFRSLKESINDTFVSIPDTGAALIHLLQYADTILEERYMVGTFKSCKIYNENEEIRKLNEEASLALNEKGCKLFDTALRSLYKKRPNLKIGDQGDLHVEETYDNDSKVVYNSSISDCNCSSFQTFQAPCVHILYAREKQTEVDSSFAIFCIDLFNTRYHRKESLISVLNEVDTDSIQDGRVDSLLFNSCPPEPNVLTDREKYKKIMPLLINIGNLIALHPTKKFHKYHEEMGKIENLVRRGVDIFDSLDFNEINEADRSEAVSNMQDEALVEASAMCDINENLTEVTENQTEFDDHGSLEFGSKVPESTLSGSSRFDALKMKAKLNRKGRPKGKCKQWTFNKTKIDRLAKKPRTKKIDNLTSVEEGSSDEEEMSEDIPYDDSSSDSLDMDDS